MGKLHILDVITRLPIPADRVVEAAIGKLETVILIGTDKEGQGYFGTSIADQSEILWEMEKLKLALLNGEFEGQ